MKKRATTIELERCEGRITECTTTTVTGPEVWEKANAVLSRWSRTAPKGGGYNKCAFVVTYEDGETYSGRYDLVHFSEERANLERHMREFCETYSGRRKPAHMKVADYERFIGFYHDRGTCEEYARFLDGYDIGGESVAPSEKPAMESYLEFLGAE